MRARLLLGLVLLFSVSAVAQAQSIAVEWLRWDAIITVADDGETITVNETQEIEVTNGTVRRGTRTWVDAVDVQGVFLVVNGRPTALEAARSGEEEGTYRLTTAGDETVLTYYLLDPAGRGDSYVVQINYTTPVENAGILDMSIVPARRGFPVNSSTVTINLPDGTTPSEELVRILSGSADVTVQGSTVILQSDGLDADQALQFQLPYGEGVGAAAGSGSGSSSGSSSASGSGSGSTSGGDTASGAGSSGGTDAVGGIDPIFIMIIIGIGVIILFGLGRGGKGGAGGNLLSSLLGMFLGGATSGRGSSNPLGGMFGGSSGGSSRSSRSTRTTTTRDSGSSERSTSGGRGFRASSDQNRSVPQVKSDKDDDGGSASFG